MKMFLDYDTAFIRHGREVAVDRILAMPEGQRALLKLDDEQRKIGIYEIEVKEQLGEHAEHYQLSQFGSERRGRFGLIIERGAA